MVNLNTALSGERQPAGKSNPLEKSERGNDGQRSFCAILSLGQATFFIINRASKNVMILIYSNTFDGILRIPSRAGV